VRWLQVLQLDGTRWAFLSGVKAQGAAPTRDALLQALSRDDTLLIAVSDAALGSVSTSTKGSSGVAAAFYALMCSEAIGRMTRVPVSVLPSLLAYVQAGLGSGASAEHRAGALLLSAQLAARAQLSAAVVETLLDGMAKIAQPPLEAAALKSMLQLMRTHAVATLSRRAVTFLVKTPALSAVLGQLAHSTQIDALIGPLLAGVVAQLGQHHTYANAFSSLVAEVPVRTHSETVTRLLLQSTSEANEETRARIVTALQALHKRCPEEVRRELDSELQQAAGLVVDSSAVALVRDAFGSTTSQPLAMSGVTITLASGLEHANPRLREAAVKQLRELLLTEASAAAHLTSVILRRSADDDAAVAAATLALPGLIEFVADDNALHAAVTTTLSSCASTLRAGQGTHAHEKAASRALSVLTQLGDRKPVFADSAARALLDCLVDDGALQSLAKAARQGARTVAHLIFVGAEDEPSSGDEVLAQQHSALRALGRRLQIDDAVTTWVVSELPLLTPQGRHTVLLALLWALTAAQADARSRAALTAWKVVQLLPKDGTSSDVSSPWSGGLPPTEHMQMRNATAASMAVIGQLWPHVARHIPTASDSSSPDLGNLGQMFGRLCCRPDDSAMAALLERAVGVFRSVHQFLALISAADPAKVDDSIQVAALRMLVKQKWSADSVPLIMVALMNPRRGVRQAAADLLTAPEGMSSRAPLAAWVKSHLEALVTGGATLQLLRGALQDAAFSGTIQQLRSCLVTLQSQYAMTQLARVLLAEIDAGTAAAFASVWHRVAGSSGSSADVLLASTLLEGIAAAAAADGSSRELLVCALESTSLSPALHAAALDSVSEALYASCSEVEQRRVLLAAISLSRRSSQPECSTAARALLIRVTFDATAVAELLTTVLTPEASEQPKPAKRSRRAATAAASAPDNGQDEMSAIPMDAKAVDIVEAVLDVLQWRPLLRFEVLATPLFRVLAALLQMSTEASPSVPARTEEGGNDSPDDTASALSASRGYRLTLTLSTLTNVVRAAKDCPLNTALIVRAVQLAPDVNVRKAALQLLTTVAESEPSQVAADALTVVKSLTSVDSISVDDAQTARALHDAFTAIAPCWVQAIKDDGAQLLRLVIDALPAVPRHRRATLLSALVHALPAPRALAATLRMLLAGDSDAHALASTLSSSRPPVESLRAWHAMLSHTTEQSVTVPTLVTVADFIASELKMTGLRAWFEHHSDDDDTRTAYAELLACALTTVERVKKDRGGRQSLDAVLSALRTLAAGPIHYVLALAKLFTHESRHVKRRALLMASRCIRGSDEEVVPSEAAQAVALHGILLPLVRSADATHPAAQVGALELLADMNARYGIHEKYTHLALASLHTAVQCAKNDSRLAVRAAALSCVASSVDALSTRVVPALPQIIATVLGVLETTDMTVPDANTATGAALAVIAKLVLNLESFLSPVLARVQRLLLSPSLCGTDVSPELRQAASDIRTNIAARVPVRLLIEPLLSSWDTALLSGSDACVAVLLQTKSLVERLDAAQTGSYCEAIFGASHPYPRSCIFTDLHSSTGFELLCLDMRRVQPSTLQEDGGIDRVEAAALDACVALVLKLSEVQFMPLFMTALEWSRASPEHFARPRVLFRLVGALSEALRSVFVPFYKHLLPDAVDFLSSDKAQQQGQPSSKKAKHDPTVTDADAMAHWQLRAEVVNALRLCFLRDTSGFIDEARFNTLAPVLIQQLGGVPPADACETAVRASDDALVDCLVQLAVSVAQDALWRTLNRGVLMVTRHASIRPRRLGVAVVAALVERLAEEYLVLLPETLPFLAELVEDTDEHVEAAARRLLARLSQLADEDVGELLN